FALECNAGGGNTTQNEIADAFCKGSEGMGWVCANTNPGQNTCVYGCHNNNDCLSNNCDKTYPVVTDIVFILYHPKFKKK
ncbi:9742_t:CDS:2, partial [Cetraspora pellucida]